MAVKSFFVFASLCWAFSSSYAQTPALDFSQARQLAHDREAAETAKRESEAKSVRSLHGPKIELDSKQIWGRKTLDYGTINLGPLLHIPIPTSIDLYHEEDIGGPRAAINAQLPIYMGGASGPHAGAARYR